MSVIPELAYIQKSSCELLFFAAPPIEGPLNFYRGISILTKNILANDCSCTANVSRVVVLPPFENGNIFS